MLKEMIKNLIEDLEINMKEYTVGDYIVRTINNKYFRKTVKIGGLLIIGAILHNVIQGEVISIKEYNDLQKTYEAHKERYTITQYDYNLLNDEKKESQKELNDLKEKTKDYRELDEKEKEIVDLKIVEVNQATEEQLAKEKAQKEAEEKAKKEAEEEAKRKAEEEEKARKEAEEQAKREAEAHKYETGLTWEQIAREGKYGTLGQFEGKILQVMQDGGYVQYRVAINGNYDTVMLIEVASADLPETLLEDDYVYFKGKSLGTITYTTVMGADVTVPAFDVDEIHR